MWPIYLREAARQGPDALGDAVMRMLAIGLTVVCALGSVILHGGAALFCGILTVLFVPVAGWPRLFGLVSGNLLMVVAGLALASYADGSILDTLARLLAAIPFVVVAGFLMMPHFAGKLALRVVPANVSPAPLMPAAPAARSPEPSPKAGPTPPA